LDVLFFAGSAFITNFIFLGGRVMNKKRVENEKKTNKGHLKHFIVLFLVLFAFWFTLSGQKSPLFLAVGVITALTATWLTRSLLSLPSAMGTKESYMAFDFPYLSYILYWIWLFKEVVKANIDVAKLVLSPKMVIQPQFFSFRKRMDNPLAHVTLANSITLTPGTITVDVIGDQYIIHAITDSAVEGLVPTEGEGEMQMRVAQLFKEEAAQKGVR
jgi:multicomponent Na+:H+ antiporter subunit E